MASPPVARDGEGANSAASDAVAAAAAAAAAADAAPAAAAGSSGESSAAESDSDSDYVIEETTEDQAGEDDVDQAETEAAAAGGDGGGGDDARELNQDLMNHCRRVFEEFESGTGFLLTRDLGSALRALGQMPSELQVEQLTASMEQAELYDKGSTKLTFQDFYQAAQQFNATKVDMKKAVMDAFHVLDKDNSGSIEVNRLISVLASVGEALGPADTRELLKELPVDKDGKVDYAKFVDEALSLDVRGATGSKSGRAKSK